MNTNKKASELYAECAKKRKGELFKGGLWTFVAGLALSMLSDHFFKAGAYKAFGMVVEDFGGNDETDIR